MNWCRRLLLCAGAAHFRACHFECLSSDIELVRASIATSSDDSLSGEAGSASPVGAAVPSCGAALRPTCRVRPSPRPALHPLPTPPACRAPPARTAGSGCCPNSHSSWALRLFGLAPRCACAVIEDSEWLAVSYIVAAAFFILSLKGLGTEETALFGCAHTLHHCPAPSKPMLTRLRGILQHRLRHHGHARHGRRRVRV